MKNTNRLVLVAVLLLCTAIYASLWSASPLTWDDGSNIFNNPYFTMHMWWGVWTEAYYGLYVPMTSSAWAFLFWVGDGQPWPFRLFNLILHLANVVLVYALLCGLARRWNLHSRFAVGLAAAGFALHPLQVEAVAWLSGGRDLLSTFFALLAVAVYFRYPRRWGYAAATLAFIFALLSKPNVAILPVVVLLLDIFLFSGRKKQAAVKMALWTLLGLFAVYLTQLAQVDHFANQVDWPARALVMLNSFRFYLQKLVWPYPLSGNYAVTPESVISHVQNLWTSAIAAGVITGAAILAWRHDRRYLIAGLWFVLLLPVSGLVPFGYEQISGVADHYAYFPMAAVSAVLLLAWNFIEQRKKWFLALPLLLACAWAAASYSRTRVWENDQTFFTDMARTAPDSYSTAMGMSVVMCEDVKDYPAGLHWVDVALAAQPDDILALANRAFCLLNSGHNKDVVAMDEYLEKLDYQNLVANQPTALSSLVSSIGTAKIKEGDLEMGFQYLCEAYRILPSGISHVHNLEAASELLRQRGLDPTCQDSTDDEPSSGEDFLNQLLPQDGGDQQ